jgi:hypothetical protein
MWFETVEFGSWENSSAKTTSFLFQKTNAPTRYPTLKDKTPVGKRLLLSAREHAYNEVVVSTGPDPVAAVGSPDHTRLTLTFDPKTLGPAVRCAFSDRSLN